MKYVPYAAAGLIVGLLAPALPALPLAPRTLAAPAAVTFTVDTKLDLSDPDTSDGTCAPGACSLRAAIMQANVITGENVTIVLPSGTYTLTRAPVGADGDDTGDLNLTTPDSSNPAINIVGAGAASTIIDGNQIDRVFFVGGGRTAAISGVTIRNGNAGASVFGGGIENAGVLTVSEVTITGNSANHGGGLDNGGTLTVVDSTISRNSANIDGGGISNEGALNLTNSTLSENSANTDGGGIYNFYRAVNVYNTTIVGNQAEVDTGSGGTAGGVYNVDGNATFNLYNTLLAGNTVANSPILDECTGTLHSHARNLIGTSIVEPCTIISDSGTHTYLNALSHLGPLQDNGGPTLTIALLPGNNGIDYGTPSVGCLDANSDPIATDQRGFARPGGAQCDMGAFEYYPPGLFLPFVRR